MEDIMALDDEKMKDDTVIADPIYPFMKDKTQLIKDYLKDGKTYKQIQDDLKVSPSRIAETKKQIEKQELIKQSLLAPIDYEKDCENSDFGSKSSKPDLFTTDFCRSAGLNGSEIVAIIAFQREKLESWNNKLRSDQEFHDKFLKNQALEAKNREKELTLKERDLKLREDELQFKIKEAERPLMELFYRLKQLVEIKSTSHWGFNEVTEHLVELKNLEYDYKKQAIADNLNFENSPHAKVIIDVIKVFEKYRLETQADPKKSFGIEIRLDVTIATTDLFGIDFHIG